jgi:hypothetical protein
MYGGFSNFTILRHAGQDNKARRVEKKPSIEKDHSGYRLFFSRSFINSRNLLHKKSSDTTGDFCFI